MTQVTRSASLVASAEEVWGVIGGFQALVDWHPAVQNSTKEEMGGVEHRRLDLGGGAEILEKWLGGDAMSYGYEIIASPLPVADYRSILAVVPNGTGCIVVWSSTFTPTVLESEAIGAIAGVYEAGLSALSDRFKG